MGQNNNASFEECRLILIDQFKSDRNKAWKELERDPLFRPSKGTLFKLFNLDEVTFNPSIREQIIEYVLPDKAANFYHLLLQQIGVRKEEQERLENYIGEYKYFRKSVDKNEERLTIGSLKIESKDGRYIFTQPSEINNYGKVVHEGFAFSLHDRVHLVGIGHRYFRPIVFKQVDSPKYDPIFGIVTTIASPNSLSVIFSSIFVLYHVDNPILLSMDEDSLLSEARKTIERFSDESGLLTLLPS